MITLPSPYSYSSFFFFLFCIIFCVAKERERQKWKIVRDLGMEKCFYKCLVLRRGIDPLSFAFFLPLSFYNSFSSPAFIYFFFISCYYYSSFFSIIIIFTFPCYILFGRREEKNEKKVGNPKKL